ncbi:hypothetical protein [Thermus sediminis]|uniref:hypothetical protein n=1 Tax=Thermus sediminis TaxID=1761908 RepID=UPI000E3B5D91|nr:hypothetical protein [Thermus sediminis]
MELAPGIWYWEEEGRISIDTKPPLFTEEGVQRFAEFAQGRMAQAAFPEEREFWQRQQDFVKGQYALWSDEERVIRALENAAILPQDESQRQGLRERLGEIIQQWKRHGPGNPLGDTRGLPLEPQGP